MPFEFTENQRFSQKWLWAILISVSFVIVFIFYMQIYKGNPVGTNPMPDGGVIVSSIIFFAIIGFFRLIRLTTEINHTKIQMRFFPFVKKTVMWSEIKTAKVLNYGFIGGWGIRATKEYGTVYNIRGNKGLAIELHNGKKLLIGTQKESELENIVNKYHNTRF